MSDRLDMADAVMKEICLQYMNDGNAQLLDLMLTGFQELEKHRLGGRELVHSSKTLTHFRNRGTSMLQTSDVPPKMADISDVACRSATARARSSRRYAPPRREGHPTRPSNHLLPTGHVSIVAQIPSPRLPHAKAVCRPSTPPRSAGARVASSGYSERAPPPPIPQAPRASLSAESVDLAGEDFIFQ